MSTLKEIEAAAEKLSHAQQAELLAFLAERVSRTLHTGISDPFEAVIGAYSEPLEATGRRAEEILYGKNP